MRADAYSPVTRIELNTADGVMAGILNDLSKKPPQEPPGGLTDTPEPKDKEEEPNVIPDEKIPAGPGNPLIEIDDPGVPQIPQTGTENKVLLLLIMLIASLGALATACLTISRLTGKMERSANI